jgi:allophanate hydrolase
MNSNTQIETLSLSFESLKQCYKNDVFTAVDVVNEIFRRINTRGEDGVWTFVLKQSEVLQRAKDLMDMDAASLPLYGIPFCVKDNIHIEGYPTTASCPSIAFIPEKTALVVKRLMDAGAILVGKNTMDQFATGLVGVRSPEHPVNLFDPAYIPGGSSSGSAVAVSAGLVSFALGSDTGGSGRIPAALNNIVGVKPTPGVLSTDGMVYANRSFDCMPIFALSCNDAKAVFEQGLTEDVSDPFLSNFTALPEGQDKPFSKQIIGIPAPKYLEFFGDANAQKCFENAVSKMKSLGATVVDVDYSIFLEAGRMLFDGPLLAERLSSIEPFLKDDSNDIHSSVRAIVEKAKQYSAVDLCHEYYRITELQALARMLFENIDFMMVPTAPTIYSIAEVKANPVKLNTNMGYYTYFANILNLSVVAVPSEIRADGLPFGVCFVGTAKSDFSLMVLGQKWQQSNDLYLGHHAGLIN